MAAYISEMTKQARKLIECGESVPSACKKAGISNQNIYASKWWKEFQKTKKAKNDARLIESISEIKAGKAKFHELLTKRGKNGA